MLWNKHVDRDGKTTLNMAEYMDYRKKFAESKEKAKKIKISKKKKGGKL